MWFNPLGVSDWNYNRTVIVRRVFSASDQNGPAWSLYWNRYVTAAPIGPLQNSKFKLDIWLGDAHRGGLAGGRGLGWVGRGLNLHTDCRAANRDHVGVRLTFLSPLWPLSRRIKPRKWQEMNEHQRLFFSGAFPAERCSLKGVYRVFSAVFSLTGSGEPQRSASAARKENWKSRFVISWQPLFTHLRIDGTF